MRGIIGAEAARPRLVADCAPGSPSVQTVLAGTAASRVLFIVWDNPLISIGPHTFIADALRRAGGGISGGDEQNWPHVSLESVVHSQPEYLIFAGDHGE